LTEHELQFVFGVLADDANASSLDETMHGTESCASDITKCLQSFSRNLAIKKLHMTKSVFIPQDSFINQVSYNFVMLKAVSGR